MIDKSTLLKPEILEIGRYAIEVALIERRNNRMSEIGRGNGLVIQEFDGTESHIIRFGPETALRIGITAMVDAIERQQHDR